MLNCSTLIGRLTDNPLVRRGNVTRFDIAVERDTSERETDYIPIVVFGKQAEICGTYLKKGRLVSVEGSIRTDKYRNKEGKIIKGFEVRAEKVHFLDKGGQDSLKKEEYSKYNSTQDNKNSSSYSPKNDLDDDLIVSEMKDIDWDHIDVDMPWEKPKV